MSSWGPGPARRVAWVDADPRIQVNRVARMRADIIYWIAAPSAMARNDKRECVWQRGNTFLHSLTTPPLRGAPP